MPNSPPRYENELAAATHRGIGFYSDESGGGVRVSYLILVPVTLLAAAAAWMRFRFGLRTMFVVSSLVAVVLGLVVFAWRG